jgi:hypothetical protein
MTERVYVVPVSHMNKPTPLSAQEDIILAYLGPELPWAVYLPKASRGSPYYTTLIDKATS